MTRPAPKKNTKPTNFDLQQAFDAHAHEDKAFQNDTRGFNGEMGVFRAETEGSLAELHHKMDTILAKFDTRSEDYAFTKMDMMYEVYEGLGFSKRMLLIIATVIGSMAVIFGGLFSTIRFLK